MIWKLLILFPLIGTAVCLMCYQCSDTSDKPGKNECQRYVRTMRKRQRLFWENRELGPYVKNCTDFGDLPENETYCYIASVRSGGTGELKSYIRDCSDGKSFFGADFNKLFTTGNVIADNQTTCMYSPQGYLACVSLCGPFDDFCNGPATTASSNQVSGILIMIVLINSLCKFH